MSKPSIFIEQSGVIPYRIIDGQIEVLLITSSTKKRWIIPKGMVEPFMTPQASAAKEAWEEAGIVGQVTNTPIGAYEYHKYGGICRVEVFLLQVETVLKDWPEAKVRRREWLSISKAIKRIQNAELKSILMACEMNIKPRSQVLETPFIQESSCL